MKILKGLFFSILALVALFFLIALFLPQAAHLDRSMSTAASPETVYGLVDGFKQCHVEAGHALRGARDRHRRRRGRM